jgi:myo-inositol-1(or 4)-monophosphatase
MFYTQRVRAAIDFAAKAHEGQLRKATRLPYIIHPLAVAMIVARYLDNEETIVAAILHDTIEDNPSVTKEMLAEEFGDRVARIVSEVSEAKTDEAGNKLPWEVRKKAQLAEMPTFSSEAWAVKVADATANLADLKAQYEREGDTMWQKFGGGKDGQIWWHDQMVKKLCRDATPIYCELVDQWQSLKEQLGI